ncbi:polyprenol phosphomannose-dependent alpha 1,6 mannosyltransferase MptB [Nocardioides terrisoli]|uniref:polyprenol phosphomannose-dependent alpha 1,6 mannosyltransferase MptB n=1 Tax=Nocardioides terrisoli TaxID=3388267 RepID=UPI00287B7A6C|nr:polyprenol phosphomannose-dependent alpha 1,6 mannosyltransferase MptB [Nocardioides marmorisolisilvae]
MASYGVAGSGLLLFSGLLYGPEPTPSWVRQTPVLHQLRSLPVHRALGMGIAFAGLALLTWSWWRLRRIVADRPDGVRRVRQVTALWVIPLLGAPPLFSGDGWSYVATGYLDGHGLSPYIYPPAVLPGPLSSAVWHGWLFTVSPYGPVPLVWGGVFSRLTSDPWVLLIAYRLLALGAVGLLAWAVPRLAARSGRNPADASALVLASPLVIAHGVGGLHNDLLMAAVMLCALVVARREHWAWAAVLAGVAASVKAPGGLVALGVVLLSLHPGARLSQRLRRTVEVGVLGAGTVVAIGIASGLGFGWVHGLAVPAHERTLLAPSVYTGHLLDEGLRGLGHLGHVVLTDLHPSTIIRIGAVALLGAVIIGTLVRTRTETIPALRGTALVMLAATLLSPVLQYWYFLWCLPLLACVRLSREQASAAVTAGAVLGLGALADPSLHVDWLDTTVQSALILLPPAAALAAWRRRGDDRPGDPARSLVRS